MPATSPLRVLVIGDSSAENVCDVYRTQMFVRPLSLLGVEVRYALAAIPADVPLSQGEIERSVAAGVDLLVAEAERSDVIVFRRAYVTHVLCLDCGFATLETGAAAAHARTTGHVVEIGPSQAVRRLFERLESDVDAARRIAIVYETDDDWLRIDPSGKQQRAYSHERDLIERMIRRADLVTVSTPVLAGRLAPLAADVRVVRNAIDPTWYGDAPGPAAADISDGSGPRVVYYGSIGRLRDYAVCAPAVDAIARRGARRIWLGAPSIASEVAAAARMFDEVHPHVAGVPAFARRLSGLRPAIGLAPLIAGPFAQARSELHWLEYSMAGAATVATSMPGGGPYDVIRHGVDGFLARTRAEWRWALERLAGSAGLRAEIVERAQARVMAEYGVDRRAIEWADAYRAAAASPGRGLERRQASSVVSDRAGGAIRGPAVANRAGRRVRGPAALAAPARRTDDNVKPSGPLSAAPPVSDILAAYVAARAFADRSPLRLLLGAGGSAGSAAEGHPAGDGWITIDTAGEPDVRHDVTFGLPFGDGSVDAIEACHVFEKLGQLAAVLAVEAVRVLRPGGTLRVLTADRLAALTRQRELQVQGVVLDGMAARLPMFTTDSLRHLLVEAGFSGVVSRPAGEGELVFEATRPA